MRVAFVEIIVLIRVTMRAMKAIAPLIATPQRVVVLLPAGLAVQPVIRSVGMPHVLTQSALPGR